MDLSDERSTFTRPCRRRSSRGLYMQSHGSPKNQRRADRPTCKHLAEQVDPSIMASAAVCSARQLLQDGSEVKIGWVADVQGLRRASGGRRVCPMAPGGIQGYGHALSSMTSRNSTAATCWRSPCRRPSSGIKARTATCNLNSKLDLE